MKNALSAGSASSLASSVDMERMQGPVLFACLNKVLPIWLSTSRGGGIDNIVFALAQQVSGYDDALVDWGIDRPQ